MWSFIWYSYFSSSAGSGAERPVGIKQGTPFQVWDGLLKDLDCGTIWKHKSFQGSDQTNKKDVTGFNSCMLPCPMRERL